MTNITLTMNANGKANGKANSKRHSNMAVSYNDPVIGERYKLHAFRKGFSPDGTIKMDLASTFTSQVIDVKDLSEGIKIVKTQYSYYITKVINKLEGNVHLALVDSVPEKGKQLSCTRIVFEGNTFRYFNILDTEIVDVKFITGLYRIETLDNIYVAFPTFL